MDDIGSAGQDRPKDAWEGAQAPAVGYLVNREWQVGADSRIARGDHADRRPGIG
jgi:hypothetical protein